MKDKIYEWSLILIVTLFAYVASKIGNINSFHATNTVFIALILVIVFEIRRDIKNLLERDKR